MRGKGEYVSFPYRRFEDAFLEFLSELTVEDVAPTSEPELNTALEEAEARKIDLDARIASMKKRVATDPNFESLLDLLGELTKERTSIARTAGKTENGPAQGWPSRRSR